MGSRETPAERRRKGPRFGANFMSVLEVSRELVCLCGEGLVIDINSAGIAMLGAENGEQVVGRAFRNLVGGDYAGVIDDLLHLKEIEDSAFPIKIVHLDGGTFEAELQIHPARELGPAYAVVTARDISRQGHLARTARHSEDRFQALVERSMHLVLLCHGGRIGYINATGVKVLGGNDPSQFVGIPVSEIFAGEYREIVASDLPALLDEGGVVPMRLARLDGSAFDAQIKATPLPSRGAAPEYMVEARDITGQIRAVAALRHMNDTLEQQVVARTHELAEERFRAVEARAFVESLLEAVPNPLWWKDIDGRYLGYNGAFRELHQISATDWVGRTTAEMVNAEFAAISAKADVKALADTGRIQFEAHLEVAPEKALDVVVNKTVWRARDKRPEGVIGVMLDITERKRMEAELRRLATTDVLTGIFNRRHFMEMARNEVDRARRHGRPMVALMLDIDHFKRINDTYGHPVGDVAIKALADVCTEIVRHEDVLGRLGGEEFAIVLTETDLDGALLVAERLRLAVAAIRIPAEQGIVAFTTSIGVAERLETDTTIDSMLSRADMALYSAKRSGRNKVAVG
ncbi:GGDEF/response regulator receiver domain protein [Paramagnetospirillum magnetotacticum MS-1]|uniref:GGDEF/response regulator receiver domain protein n=1 Tax=Paramagnetospirillum magnetotacticum MS-1 TaxID=272627 RepID=A0A0C2YTG0_PARME|nr:diguanylate cyclase [Paramagnetospirillum magnetotacticum]KIL97985.1 GGDEF/response regulator receiver domain protein [Paramagnetospirillum magnetotacticum MS-1]